MPFLRERNAESINEPCGKSLDLSTSLTERYRVHQTRSRFFSLIRKDRSLKVHDVSHLCLPPSAAAPQQSIQLGFPLLSRTGVEVALGALQKRQTDLSMQ